MAEKLSAGNIINGSGRAGVTIYRASHINVLNNTIIDPNENGIAIISASEPSSNVKVNHNYIQNPLNHGIYVSSEQEFVEVVANTIEQVKKAKRQ